ncbi:PhoH family protein [Parendozoicomonas haliclonae]|uniref:PhoH-like protein n=1 Tax=Parendozoicomonas haliclonae TaxID=1960125 RepID=A0A1X7AMM4_9GAMM|nr:PhoH family protein [Parendozoicomonas haliclonae]SMA49542.1 PhoH-like protein [Parendozoicomonas haliclonae]
MNTQPDSLQFDLEPIDARRFAELCGQFNEHLKHIENRLGIRVSNRGQSFTLSGEDEPVQTGKELIERLYAETAENTHLTPEMVHLLLQESGMEPQIVEEEQDIVIRTRKGLVRPRGKNQQQYVKTITSNDINFGIGPAGTGKTYLAVACAVQALEQEEIQRILLVRPAVEAGEKLGFLPGDLSQKIDPYLRPLYDALYEMLGFDRVTRLIEKNVIEVAPLAYMRGRTLNNAYIILDESQNTTMEQMKMFLTRIGFGSTAVITGDITQVDLPRNVRSGLRHAMEVLEGVPGIGMTQFSSRDVVRHPLVQRIVEAYDRHDQLTSATEQNSVNKSHAGKGSHN